MTIIQFIQLPFPIFLCIECIMDITWIEDFLALSRTQNFCEAAIQRCTTQPAFSRRIRQLEDWLGVTLFERSSRPIHLTPEGEDFLRRAQRLREDILDARRIAMSSRSHFEKTARLYTTTAIAIGVLPEWLKAQGTLNHSILTSSSAGCLEALRQNRADRIFLPFFSKEVRDGQLNYEKIAQDDLILVEHAHTRQKLVHKKNTLRGAIIMHTPGSIFGQQISRHLAEVKITCDNFITCESSSVETILALVKQGFGSAWLPSSMAEHDAVTRCAVTQKTDVPCAIMSITRESGTKKEKGK